METIKKFLLWRPKQIQIKRAQHAHNDKTNIKIFNKEPLTPNKVILIEFLGCSEKNTIYDIKKPKLETL